MESNERECGLEGCTKTFTKTGRKEFCSDLCRQKAHRGYRDKPDPIVTKKESIVTKKDPIVTDNKPIVTEGSDTIEEPFVSSKSAEIIRDLHDSIMALPVTKMVKAWEMIGLALARGKQIRSRA